MNKTFNINTGGIKKIASLIGPRLYNDRYSFINEIYQNAIDASRKSGTSKKIEMGIMIKKEIRYLYIRDYGCSFESVEEFEYYIGGITNSKKEGDVNQIGEYGIGSLSPSAYHYNNNNFTECKWFYEVYKNGMMFEATIDYREEDGFSYTTTEPTKTDEKDGVLFYINVGYDSIRQEVEKKLEADRNYIWLNRTNQSYESVIGTINSIDKKIIDKDDFLILPQEEIDFRRGYKRMRHKNKIIVDTYVYDIDNGYDFPVYFKMKKEDMSIPATRETATVKKESMSVLSEKMKNFINYIKEEWNKQYPTSDFQIASEYINYIENDKGKIIKLEGYNFDISFLPIDIKDVKYKGELINNTCSELLYKAYNGRNNVRVYKNGSKIKYITSIFNDCAKFFTLNKKRLPAHILNYLKDNYNNFVIVPETIAKENLMSDFVKETAEKIENLKIPKDKKQEYKRKKREKKEKNEFTIEHVVEGVHYNTWKLEKHTQDFKKIKKNSYLTIYGLDLNIKDYGHYSSDTVVFARVTPNVEKKLKELNYKNWINFKNKNEWMPYIKREATLFYLRQKLDRLLNIEKYNIISKYNTELGDFLNVLNNTLSKHRRRNIYNLSDVEEFFKEKKCYYYPLHTEYMRLKKTIEHYMRLHIVINLMTYNNEDKERIIKDYLKQNNIRWKNLKK